MHNTLQRFVITNTVLKPIRVNAYNMIEALNLYKEKLIKAHGLTSAKLLVENILFCQCLGEPKKKINKGNTNNQNQ